MLKQLVEKKHCGFAAKADNWEEAIKMSCKVLEEDGTVDTCYAQELIRQVQENGPYIVICPNVALPHTKQGAKGVHKTAISFLCLEEPVSFDESDPDKSVQLFFTLASCNETEHSQNMEQLSDLLMDEDLLMELAKATCEEDLLRLQEKLEGGGCL